MFDEAGPIARLTEGDARPGAVVVAVQLPGVTDGELASSIDQGIAATPLGRFGRPDEVAGVVCFLASAAAAHINGTEVSVSGGQSA